MNPIIVVYSQVLSLQLLTKKPPSMPYRRCAVALRADPAGACEHGGKGFEWWAAIGKCGRDGRLA